MNLVGLGLIGVGLLTGVINGRIVEKDLTRSTASLEENNRGGTSGLSPLLVGAFSPVIIQLLAKRPETLAWAIGHEIGLGASIVINSRK